MSKFIITIDSACDCTKEELAKKDVAVIPFNYSDEDTIYVDEMTIPSFKVYYDKMRNGAFFKTSQINPHSYYEFFKSLMDKKLPIIHISLCKALSNTLNSAATAVNTLKEDYPDCDIRLLDSKLASLGLAILMDKLVEMRNSDLTVDEAMEKINYFVDHLNAYYTTNTLKYFARGGRLSKLSAFLGNVIGINPVLDCSKDGGLRVIGKIRGQKHAIEYLFDKIKETVIDPENQTLYVCHADNEEKAIELSQRFVKEIGFKGYELHFMGPIIGGHTGPGLVAFFFLGKERSEK